MRRLLSMAAMLVGCGRISFDPTASDAAGTDVLPASPCDDAPASGAVALYTFDAALGDDATGAHPASVRGTVSQVPGACDQAARFATGYLLVPDVPAFALGTGSIELYVRLSTNATADNQTLIARDGEGTATDGHVLVLVNTEGALIARIQRGGATFYRCAPVVPIGRWVHVGLAFGGVATRGFRMWLDHVEATEPTSMLGGGPITCTDPLAGGIDGNANAFVIGASNARSVDGAADPAVIDQFLADGELDHVRISATWRDFGAP